MELKQFGKYLNTMLSRDKLIKFWIGYCLFVALSTEVLSAFNLINRSFFLDMYVLLAVTFGIVLIKNLFKNKVSFRLPKYWIWYLILIVLVFIPLLLIALYYPPNNYDSMTYHLPRVEHWIQNKNVKFYQTNNSRQLFMSPMAEYVILHWRILVGEDNLVNLVQYVSMILSVIVATLVVKEWKGSKFAQLLAAVLVTTIPMGIMQSTSTQNDYVTAFFTIASLYFYLRNDFIYLALCIGLGIFTKSTYVIFVLPLGLYWFITWIKKDSYRVWRRIVLIILFTFLINGAHWFRNYKYFGSMFGPRDMSEAMFNRSFEPKYIVSNIVRNIGTQIGLPSKQYNMAVDNIVEAIHQKLGIKTDDFFNSWYSEKYKTQFSIHEDLSGNLIIFLLFYVSGIILIFKKYKIWPTYLAIFFGWILFNILLKWQPWQSRLELPFFVSLSPVVALVTVRFVKNNLLIHFLVLLLFIFAIPFVVGNFIFGSKDGVSYTSTRPLITEIVHPWRPRFERFLLSGAINPIYYEVVKEMGALSVRDVVLDLGGNSWEYPLYVALRYENMDIRVSYVNFVNSFLSENLRETVLLTDREIENSEYDELELFSSKPLYLYYKSN